jgi:folate-dependent phosphoribosylglycinamide formyltransferase PurN
LRLSWKYQINRKLSLRFIAQYNTVDANSKQTSLQTIKNFNVDFLIIYLIYPGTAIWIGYNNNLQNIDPALLPDSSGLRRTDHSLINDGRQLFIKVSYLLRF